MHHVTYADKVLFVDDETALCLVAYAAALATAQAADSIQIEAIGQDGNEVTATFLLATGTGIMVESTTGVAEPPSNVEALAYMQTQIARLQSDPHAQPLDASDLPGSDYV